jgi:hypothetical protein
MGSTALSAAVAAAVLVTVAVLRPGFVAQAAGSPLAWLTVLGVLLLVLGTRRVVGRMVGPRAATAAGLVVSLVATALLVGPSFRQRTLNEPLPAALQQPVPTDLPAAASPTAAPPAQAAPTAVPTAPTAPTAREASAPTRTAAPAAPAEAPAAPASPAAAAAPAPAASAQPAPRSAPPERQLVGELRGIDHSASGQIILYPGGDRGVVRFQDVDIEGSVGPSVHLVPAGSRRPGGGIRLGALKAERGSFSYQVPASADLRSGWSVLVWCDPYDVPIAAADPV